MAITLGAVILPDGLRWSDEFAWNSTNLLTEYSLTGALIVDMATKQAGRPVTLTGGANFAWYTRAQVIALQAVLDAIPSTGATLTLHDSRTFTVIPIPPALSVTPLPVVMDSGPADPTDSTMYAFDSLKLETV